MTELLWIDLVALAAGSVVAVLDLDVQVGSHKAGRPLYGTLVLLGLLGTYIQVVETGALPVPGWGIALFAVLYLPFLSHSFIDLDQTDRLARGELEALLLEKEFPELKRAYGQNVIRQGRRKFRIHWEANPTEEGVVLELDVHPSLMPITVSRPHVATIRDQHDLERIRNDIRVRRASGYDG